MKIAVKPSRLYKEPRDKKKNNNTHTCIHTYTRVYILNTGLWMSMKWVCAIFRLSYWNSQSIFQPPQFSLSPRLLLFFVALMLVVFISASFSFNKNEKWRHGVCRTSAPTHAQLSYTITIYVQYKHNSYMHLIYRSANKSTYSCKLVAHPRNLTYIAFITRNWYTAIAKKADTLTRTKLTERLRMEMNKIYGVLYTLYTRYI